MSVLKYLKQCLHNNYFMKIYLINVSMISKTLVFSISSGRCLYPKFREDISSSSTSPPVLERHCLLHYLQMRACPVSRAGNVRESLLSPSFPYTGFLAFNFKVTHRLTSGIYCVSLYVHDKLCNKKADALL